MDKKILERIIDLVEKHFIEPTNSVMTFRDWIKIREEAKQGR